MLWFGGHWILQELSWKKCILNYNLKERKEVMKQRKELSWANIWIDKEYQGQVKYGS